jgi:hypothetical protein
MKRVDMEALRRAIAMPRASDPLRDQQIASMLEEREWLEVAEFAAYCCQTEALNLRPWQPPPCDMGAEKPVDDFALAGRVAAWELRKQLIASGLSAYEPNPVGALHCVEEAKQQAT